MNNVNSTGIKYFLRKVEASFEVYSEFFEQIHAIISHFHLCYYHPDDTFDIAPRIAGRPVPTAMDS